MERFKCCICGLTFEGWGNNPWPVNKSENARCCDFCNRAYVIPERLKGILNGKS